MIFAIAHFEFLLCSVLMQYMTLLMTPAQLIGRGVTYEFICLNYTFLRQFVDDFGKRPNWIKTINVMST